ncbi:hypothetical protein D3C71_1882640 [compost metagenome]
MNLPVDVGDIHYVLVNHDNTPYSTAGQGFSCNGAYAADTEHGNGAVLQNLQPFRA